MYYVGVDLGGTKMAAGLITKDGDTLFKASVPTLRERHYSDIVKDMSELILKVISGGGANISQVKYIGIGSPGTVDSEKGIAVYCNGMNFRNAPIRAELQKYISVPVFMENDANCAALAESTLGSARGLRHSITVTLGTGIGGGVTIDGKIYKGFNNAAGEVGHMVIESNGQQCTCGRRGCWERYASGSALMKQTKKAAEENPDSLINKLCNGDITAISGKTAFDAAKFNDETGKKWYRNILGMFQRVLLI